LPGRSRGATPPRVLCRDVFAGLRAVARRAFLWQFGEAPRGRAQKLGVKLSLVDGKIAGCVGYIPIG
jgi:hypothetical protein